MVNTKYNLTHDMIDEWKQLKVKTKLPFYRIISNYYDEFGYRRRSINFQFEEDFLSKNAQGIRKNYHEVLLNIEIFTVLDSCSEKEYYLLWFVLYCC